MQNRYGSSGHSGGVRALWLAAAGALMGLLLACGVVFDHIDFGVAAFLFVGAPLAEAAAVIVGLWAGRGSLLGRLAAAFAAACLGVWGWFFFKLMTTPLIKLF